MPENVLRIASLIVDLGKERVKVVGAAAAIIVQIILHANELNSMVVGSAQLDWSNGKACLRISKSFEPIFFDLEPSRVVGGRQNGDRVADPRVVP